MPKYSRHSSGQARVRLAGKVYYLGEHGSAASKREYNRLIARRLESHQLSDRGRRQLTVGKLATLYMQHAKTYYRKGGGPTSQQCIVRNALRRLVRAYRNLPVSELSPKRIKAVRQQWIEEGKSRKYINGIVGIVKSMVRWGNPSARQRSGHSCQARYPRFPQ